MEREGRQIVPENISCHSFRGNFTSLISNEDLAASWHQTGSNYEAADQQVRGGRMPTPVESCRALLSSATSPSLSQNIQTWKSWCRLQRYSRPYSANAVKQGKAPCANQASIQGHSCCPSQGSSETQTHSQTCFHQNWRWRRLGSNEVQRP